MKAAYTRYGPPDVVEVNDLDKPANPDIYTRFGVTSGWPVIRQVACPSSIMVGDTF